MLFDLLSLPESGVYALVNEIDKKVLIVSSSDLVSSYLRLIKGIQSGSSTLYRNLRVNTQSLIFVLLEKVTDKYNLTVRRDYFEDYYRNNGYSLYALTGKRVKYTIKTNIIHVDFSPKCIVYLRSNRGSKVVVGAFDNVDECNTFVETHYSNGVPNIVYSDNESTKKYKLRELRKKKEYFGIEIKEEES